MKKEMITIHINNGSTQEIEAWKLSNQFHVHLDSDFKPEIETKKRFSLTHSSSGYKFCDGKSKVFCEWLVKDILNDFDVKDSPIEMDQNEAEFLINITLFCGQYKDETDLKENIIEEYEEFKNKRNEINS